VPDLFTLDRTKCTKDLATEDLTLQEASISSRVFRDPKLYHLHRGFVDLSQRRFVSSQKPVPNRLHMPEVMQNFLIVPS
jgi:hypothetical protein